MFKSFGIKNNKKSKFEIVGSNLKMSNINALFGIKQIQIYKKILEKKEILLSDILKNYQRIKIFKFKKIQRL